MIRINQNEGTTATSGQTQDTQAPKSQRYLLSQPIQDTTSFSSKEEQQPKKNNTMAWIVGLGATIAAVVIAVKTHKKADTKAVEKAAEEAKPTRSGGGGGGSRRILREEIILDRKAEELKSLKSEVIKSLGGDLKITEADLEKPSEIVNKFLSQDKEYDSKTIENLYKFTKRQAVNIKDPVEAEKNTHSGINLLNDLYHTYQKEGNADGVRKAKLAIGVEIEGLFEHHFGKDNSLHDVKELMKGMYTAEKTDLDLRKMFTEAAKKGKEVPQSALFPVTLTQTADEILKSTMGKLQKEGKQNKKLSIFATNDIKTAKMLNEKSIEIFDKMGIQDAELTKNTTRINKTIQKLESINVQHGLNTFKKHIKANNINIEGVDVNKLTVADLSKPEVKTGLKNAYRKLSVKYHPDKNLGTNLAEENFKEINEAFEFLNLNNTQNTAEIKNSIQRALPEANIAESIVEKSPTVETANIAETAKKTRKPKTQKNKEIKPDTQTNLNFHDKVTLSKNDRLFLFKNHLIVNDVKVEGMNINDLELKHLKDPKIQTSVEKAYNELMTKLDVKIRAGDADAAKVSDDLKESYKLMGAE